jgi:2-polyprenyl-6-methoxyphenol hydroxylase-like FAD-dependent oxidoreductase
VVSNVLVVGDGIAGMSLAVAVRDSGIRAEIVELHPGWTALGIGIALTAPTLRALRTLGLLDRCIEAGRSVTRVGTIDANTFEVSYLGEAPRLAGPEYPASLGIMRPVVHRILAEAARAAGARVRLGLTLASIRQTPTRRRWPSPMARAAATTWSSAPTACIRRCASWSGART